MRPIKNKSNFLDKTSEQILWAAANRMATSDYPALSLIGVGWLKVVRYGGESKYMYVHLCREMFNHIKRMQVLQTRCDSFYKPDGRECNSIFWTDLLDGLSAAERAVLVLYYKGKNTMVEVGKILGVSRETIRLHLLKITKKLRR